VSEFILYFKLNTATSEEGCGGSKVGIKLGTNTEWGSQQL
jgi:hypothetical protein